MKKRRLPLALACLLAASCGSLKAGSIDIEFDGSAVKKFDARGCTYAELHKLVSAFTGTTDRLLAAPPQKMQLTVKDTTWAEIMLQLYDPSIFNVQKDAAGGLTVTRKK